MYMNKRPVNLIVGRFQPVTKGHVRCLEMAYKKTGVMEGVMGMIEVPDSKTDTRHPFPSSLLVPLYKDLFQDNPLVEDIVLIKNADIVAISDILAKKGYEIRSWVCGSDRYRAYSTMADKYHDKANLPEDFQVIEISRGEEDESATKARSALLEGNENEFYKLFPAINLKARLRHDYYKELREQIERASR